MSEESGCISKSKKTKYLLIKMIGIDGEDKIYR